MRNLTGEVTTLSELMMAHEAKMKQLLEDAAVEKKSAERIAQVDLPELMLEAEMQEFTMTNGNTVKVKEHVHAAITEANNQEALKWLRDNGFGGLIKAVVTVSFTASEEGIGQATELSEKLSETYSNDVEMKQTVHAARLKAFVKEQLEDGKDIPRQLFGVHTFSEAEVKVPKRR
jgi:hypothetical protein